jgi:hypothetical protein
VAVVLGATPNHIPHKIRCPIEITDQIRHVYLIMFMLYMVILLNWTHVLKLYMGRLVVKNEHMKIHVLQ